MSLLALLSHLTKYQHTISIKLLYVFFSLNNLDVKLVFTSFKIVSMLSVLRVVYKVSCAGYKCLLCRRKLPAHVYVSILLRIRPLMFTSIYKIHSNATLHVTLVIVSKF